MEHHWPEWLQQSYSEAPAEGPDAKRMKFSTIHEKLCAAFPNDTVTTANTSQAVQRVFPNTQNKRIGREMVTYVFGKMDVVHEHQSTTATSSTHDPNVQNELHVLRDRVRQLEARVCELETTCLPSGHNLQFSQQFDTLLQHGTQI